MDDPEFREMLKLYEEAGKAFGASQIVNFWPILKHVPVVSHNYKVCRFKTKLIFQIDYQTNLSMNNLSKKVM